MGIIIFVEAVINEEYITLDHEIILYLKESQTIFLNEMIKLDYIRDTVPFLTLALNMRYLMKKDKLFSKRLLIITIMMFYVQKINA